MADVPAATKVNFSQLPLPPVLSPVEVFLCCMGCLIHALRSECIKRWPIAVCACMVQGQCRACWAFASAAAIETLWATATNKLVDISPQAFVDCFQTAEYYGCEGAVTLPMVALTCQAVPHLGLVLLHS